MLEKLADLNKILTVADKVAIISIVLCSLILIILTPHLVASSQGNKDVVVTLENQEIYRYSLLSNQQLKRFKFSFEVEGESYQGVLKMKNGRVKLERLSQDISPLPIHAEMGWISKPHQMIVCLPVKLTVTIESDAVQNNNIDVKTF